MTVPANPVPTELTEDERIPGLTDMQSRYVHEYLHDPSSQTRAAIRAGYARSSAYAIASRMMRNPLIAQAILDGTRVQLSGATAEALKVQVRLMRSAKSDLVRQKASEAILDRAGLSAGSGGGGGAQLSVTFNLG